MVLIFRVESSSIISVLRRRNEQTRKSTVPVQTDEHLRHKLAMNGKGGHKEQATYYRRDFGNDGHQEPNETLVNGAAYQRTESTTASEEHQ